jgi:SAM-dependent methyltransferase
VHFDDSVLDRETLLASAAASMVDRSRPMLTSDIRRPPYLRKVLENLTNLRAALPSGGRVLVVGGGVAEHGTSTLYDDATLEVAAFDIYASHLTQFVADAHRIPLVSGVFDAVVIQAVLEHVLDPWRVVQEVHRVLKPGGLVYSETPFMQQVHEGAYDFTRFTDSGHRYLFRNFELIDSGPIGGPGLVAQWTLDYLIRGVTGSDRAGRRSRRLLQMLNKVDERMGARRKLDSASAVYFTGRRSDRTMSPAEIVDYYREVRESGAEAALMHRAQKTWRKRALETRAAVRGESGARITARSVAPGAMPPER